MNRVRLVADDAGVGDDIGRRDGLAAANPAGSTATQP
jgi:hypothetical protein